MGTLEGGGTVHHSDGNKRNKSVTWSVEADVARPPHAVFLRGDERELESNDECGVAPCVCTVMVATTRQPTRGPISMVPLCQVEGSVAPTR